MGIKEGLEQPYQQDDASCQDRSALHGSVDGRHRNLDRFPRFIHEVDNIVGAGFMLMIEAWM
jgi:hypothetical protein